MSRQTRLKISFCTVCMNRMYHLRQTLPENIKANIIYGNVEFIILDYNSTDGLADWIKTDMAHHIASGILKFYKTEEPQQFHRSHSRNMAFRLGDGDILCNVDADNYLGEGFAQFINETFTQHDNIYLTPNYGIRDVIGRLAIKKADFFHFRGYNEEMEEYGFEDIELYRRLMNNRRLQIQFADKSYTQVIYHSNAERISNEYIGKNCLHVLIRYLDNKNSMLTFLYKDGTYEAGTYVDTSESTPCQVSQNIFDNMVSLTGAMQTGRWFYTDRSLCIEHNGDKARKFRIVENQNTRYYYRPGEKQYEVTDKQFKTDLMLLKTEVYNRRKLSELLKTPYAGVNKNGFGQGKVIKNFLSVTYLD